MMIIWQTTLTSSYVNFFSFYGLSHSIQGWEETCGPAGPDTFKESKRPRFYPPISLV